jgi:4-phospho-D-threonate 3-dehydrogenase / 4-phospho-D-erythronate 3-dehydrogenase
MALPLIGITMGDPTGIGPEILVKALSKTEPYQACRPIVFGDHGVLLKAIGSLGIEARVEVVDRIPEEGYLARKIYLFQTSRLHAESLRVGQPDSLCGEAMVNSIREATRWMLERRLDALTTCPINKQAINRAGYPFSGHTELLAHLAGSPQVAMMFIGTSWRVVLVTTHLPLIEVAKRITKDRVLSTVQITDQGMKRHFGIPRPRIAVLGLNPHCGEEGLLGEEEEREIFPAIEQAKSLSIDAEGPFPADSFFDLSHRSFDVVIAMYHDQGLIPIKMSGFMDAVNFTLGLPFIRTSVAHGTAYDLVGLGVANETNLIKALAVASNLSKTKRDS